MGHVSNTIGAILIILATIAMAGGAGALTYGMLDGDAAQQEVIRDRDRVNQDEQMVAGGGIAMALGLGLFIIGVVLAAQPGNHRDEVSNGLVATRKTFGVILLILSILMVIVGTGLFSYGFVAEDSQGNGFNYDSDEGQVNIAMATAGAVLLALGIALLISSIVMVSKGDKVVDTTAEPPVNVAEPANLKAGKEEQISLQEIEETPNRNALFVLAGIAGFAMLIAVIFLAMYGTGGNGGLFSDAPVYNEESYNYTMANTGNAPVIGTIGEAWVEEFSTLDRVSMLTLTFQNDGASSMSYTLEQMNEGVWEAIASETSSSADFSFELEGEFADSQFRFRVEPSQSFVSSADLGVLVIQQS